MTLLLITIGIILIIISHRFMSLMVRDFSASRAILHQSHWAKKLEKARQGGLQHPPNPFVEKYKKTLAFRKFLNNLFGDDEPLPPHHSQQGEINKTNG